jgi:uncharacterized protein
METYTIVNNPELSRFESQVEGGTARLDYRINAGMFIIDFVFVPTRLRGRGLGAALVDEAARWAEDQKLEIYPICGFAREYIRRKGTAGD